VKTVTSIPLGQNFLKTLAGTIVEHEHDPSDPLALSRVTVLLPHRRGITHLHHYLSTLVRTGNPTAFLLPRIITIEDFVQEMAVTIEEPSRRKLSTADQAWVLFNLVRDLGRYGNVAESWDRFFAWGIRLADLLDEVDRELVEPRDIIYPDNVPPEAVGLLEGLKTLSEAFDHHLTEESYTTSGKRFRTVAQRVRDLPAREGPVYLAGFYALTRSEERLFRHLFIQGAHIFWHADTDALPPLYQRWKQDWHLDVITETQATRQQSAIHFYETYDLHSELQTMEEILPGEVSSPDECVLVLPDPAALVPTLDFLPPNMTVNISLGYPLERTALAALLQQLMQLEEGRNDQGAYYHQDYLPLIRHPYVRRLTTPSGKEGRIILHLLEEKIRRYATPFLADNAIVDLLNVSEDSVRDRDLLAAEGLDLEDAAVYLRELNTSLLHPWQTVRTPGELASAVREVLHFLFVPLLDGEVPPRSHLLDNEFLFALNDSVLPTLEQALFVNEHMDTPLLFSFFKTLVHLTRIPFEGHPLVGLQVLGLLETRLLSFDKVIILDLNEDVVPAHQDVNPLLPEPLKPAVGLPGREREEAVTRYHFERLIHSAGEANLLWQSSTLPASSGLEGKKVRSRFVEALLWDRERDNGMLLDDTVTRTTLEIAPESLVRHEGLEKTPADRHRVEEFLETRSAQTGLSATLLNRYLTCPLQFYYRDLLGLSPTETVIEDVDSAELGSVIHRTLEDYFTPYQGTSYIPSNHNDIAGLLAIFQQHFGNSAMYACLPPEKRFFIEETVAYRLKAYLNGLSGTTFIWHLEREYRLPLTTSMGTLFLVGKMDRIDVRDGLYVILDYKTGSVVTPAKSHFEKRLVSLIPPLEPNYSNLKTIRETLGDVQLPLYVLLVTGGKKSDLRRTLSAYVALRQGGKEQYFIAQDRLQASPNDYVTWYSRTFPDLLCYLIHHMYAAPCFYPATDERACSFCDHQMICPFSLG
jgi:hypothetical protein